MRYLKYLLFVIFGVLICPLLVKAESIEVTLFDSNITVNQDRTLDVEEKYKLYFIEDTKKITRKLSKNITVVRPDKSKVLIDTKISNIKSTTKYTTQSKSNINSVILSVDGGQDETNDYDLEYRYNLGKDTGKNNDELYYDIVSNLDAPVSNLTFTVTFPSKIDEKSVKFLVDGIYNLTDDDVTYTIKDNVISGTYNKLLKNNQNFSIYVSLPNGYFKGTSDNFNYMIFLILIIPIIGSFMSIVFWFKYGKGKKLRVKRSAEIPNNFDSAEIGYLYKGLTDEKDLATLVIYLANKGYLQILENDDGYKLGKENSFKFIKLKDYDKNNAAQELIFNEMFRNREEANLSDIEYHFADTFKEAKDLLDSQDNHKKIFFKNLKMVKFAMILFIILSVLVINYNSVYLFTNMAWLIIPMTILIFIGIYIFFISNSSGIVKFVLGGAILGFSLYVGIFPLLVQSKLFTIYIIGTILITLMCMIYKTLSERTKYGVDALSKAYGLKYYLETISKQELEQKINENSNYYFDMIPYAYVLSSLDVWFKKGRNIITSPPSWYLPSSEFSMHHFEQFVKNVIYTTTLVMLKQVYSESELITYENSKVKTNLND